MCVRFWDMGDLERVLDTRLMSRNRHEPGLDWCHQDLNIQVAIPAVTTYMYMTLRTPHTSRSVTGIPDYQWHHCSWQSPSLLSQEGSIVMPVRRSQHIHRQLPELTSAITPQTQCQCKWAQKVQTHTFYHPAFFRSRNGLRLLLEFPGLRFGSKT